MSFSEPRNSCYKNVVRGLQTGGREPWRIARAEAQGGTAHVSRQRSWWDGDLPDIAWPRWRHGTPLDLLPRAKMSCRSTLTCSNGMVQLSPCPWAASGWSAGWFSQVLGLGGGTSLTATKQLREAGNDTFYHPLTDIQHRGGCSRRSSPNTGLLLTTLFMKIFKPLSHIFPLLTSHSSEIYLNTNSVFV